MTGRKRMSARTRKKAAARRVLAAPVLPKSEQLQPVDFTRRMIQTMKAAPHGAVVDTGFDAICKLHGYIPMRVLNWLVEMGLVFVDDSHEHKVITLTERGLGLGAGSELRL